MSGGELNLGCFVEANTFEKNETVCFFCVKFETVKKTLWRIRKRFFKIAAENQILYNP
jgi:hypothetical protein